MRANTILGLARRLLTREAGDGQDQTSLREAAGRVLDKLRAHLSQRIGQEGFRTLLARALTLTTPQFPHLSAIQVGADGSLIGLSGEPGPETQETEDGGTQATDVDGAVALVAHLLGLLVTFIGEDITLRMLATVWPGLTLSNETGLEDEKT